MAAPMMLNFCRLPAYRCVVTTATGNSATCRILGHIRQTPLTASMYRAQLHTLVNLVPCATANPVRRTNLNLVPTYLGPRTWCRYLHKEPVKALIQGSHKKDGVSVDQTLIYRNSLIPTVFCVNVGLHPLCALSVVLGFHNIYDTWVRKNYDFGLLFEHDVFRNSVCYIGAAIYILFCAREVSKRTFIRIYYSEKDETFTGILRKSNMIGTEKMIFEAQDVGFVKPGKIFGHFAGNYLVKNRKFIINPTDFRNPGLMSLMVGALPEEEEEDEEEEIEMKSGSTKR